MTAAPGCCCWRWAPSAAPARSASPLRFAPVAVVAPFDYVQLLWAVLLGWMIFAHRPLATTWLGAAIIMASGLYTLYREHRLGREAAREAAAL